MLLFPDPRPLVDRLGRDFFRSLPEKPGVYVMRDAADAVIYIGKARSLRQRLGSYRVANPGRMPRRHLRMLRVVAHIELHECPDEASALLLESKLLRAMKPKFNRAGTWPSTPRFLAWRRSGKTLGLGVFEDPPPGWERIGPMGAAAIPLRNALARLLWCAVHPALGPSQLPCGWNEGQLTSLVCVEIGGPGEEAGALFEESFQLIGQPPAFCEWVRGRMPADLHPFDRAAIEADLEVLSEIPSKMSD